jgi:hypothetical protein
MYPVWVPAGEGCMDDKVNNVTRRISDYFAGKAYENALEAVV